MFLLKWLAASLVLWQRVWCRLRMLLLRPLFRRHGKHFVFDPDDTYTFKNIEVGDHVSIGSGAMLVASESSITIGNKVMFGPNVTIIGGDHNTSVVGRFMYDVRDKHPEDDQDVSIEDDVWVGAGATILKGVRLGRGSVVAAGAVVNKEVLPYTIVGGIPAKIISMRFGEIETILEHEKALYSPPSVLT
jgi:acetyltransferase-like isoleucine patch superfamily enzyme